MKKCTLEEIKEIYFKQFPLNKLEFIKYNSAKEIYVKNKYGICKTNLQNLLKIKTLTIQSSVNKEEYLTNQIKEKFPLIDYKIVKYTNQLNVIVENKYGLCKLNSTNLLKGKTPSIVTAIDKTSYFLNSLDVNFKENYDFDKIVYKTNTSKITISCKKHGEFLTNPSFLLRKMGCPKCGFEKIKVFASNNPTGWSYTNWFKSAKKSKNYDSFKVYIIKCWNDKEEFYKIMNEVGNQEW